MRAALGAGLLCASLASAQTPPPGAINGSVVDDTGTAISGARISLQREEGAAVTEEFSRADGRFSFSSVPAGPFRLTLTAPGFAQQTLAGAVRPGEVSDLPPIRLTLAATAVSIDVMPTIVEVAQQQIKEQEQQRIFGVLPNFFVTYDPNAAPLSARQKFELSWRSHLDPVQFGVVGVIAGIQHERNDYSGFGTGVEGYAKRYAALYATVLTRGVINQVLLPSVFKQDPRYFYRGTGSATSRFLYAISRTVIRRGDNGRSQPNYSGILGSFAAGGISNLYYPEEDRRGVRLTIENTAIGIGGSAVGHIFQEFVFDKLTTRARRP